MKRGGEQQRHAVEQGVDAFIARSARAAPRMGTKACENGALGEQAAQQVGDAEGDPESVGERAGAEGARDEDIARFGPLMRTAA